MLLLDVFCCGALMLCCTEPSEALQVSHGQQLNPAQDPTATDHTPPSTDASSASRHFPLCFMDDILALLRDAVGNDGELTNSSLAQFGVCSVSESSSVLLQLAKETSRDQTKGLEVLHPTGVLFAEDGERGTLTLTFDLPQSPLLKLNSVLLLVYESPVTGGNMDVTFTSQSLHPSTQTVCLSAETRHILLMGKASEVDGHQKWRISVQTKTPDSNQSLRDVLIGGTSGRMIPLLLFSGEPGTDTRCTHASGSSQTSFICELKRFLGDVLPQDHPDPPSLQLDSLQSLPPLILDRSSSDTLLAGLINSSSPTIFSFASWGSVFQVHHGELASSPVLLEELKLRLEQTVMKIMKVIREEEVGQRATERLERLKDLSAFPKKRPAAGEIQYRAFLLLKALQTVARVYEVQRGMRSTRAGPSSPARGSICGLRSLSVFLDRRLGLPNTVNINNCHGSCVFPMANANNHAVLLNFHIESGNTEERAPCCVPVAYEALEVVDLNEHGTYLSIKPDVVAKECGCR